jgi:hypothetical protein
MTTKSLFAAAAVLAAIAAPAMAQSVTPGHALLAAAAGVDAADYSLGQIVRLNQAVREGDATTVNFILSNPQSDVVAAARNNPNFVTDGELQLAAKSGVEATGYTLGELVRLNEAVRDGDALTFGYVRSGANRATPADAATVTPAEAQLAASLGVDPAEYTLSELGDLRADR